MKMVDGQMDGRQWMPTDDGQTTEHAYTISSPMNPKAQVSEKGDKHDKFNYRPISILPVLSKIIERYVSEHVKNYLDSKKLLYECQFGFRKDHSCETALTTMVADWITAIDKNEVVGTVFDFSKAFDLVDHKLLPSKQGHYKFSSNTLRYFSSYLEQRCQQVSVSGKLFKCPAHIIWCASSVCFRASALHYMGINDLAIEIEKSVIYFFADDATLTISGISLVSITKDLNADGSKTVNWGSRNKMSIHEQKTKAMFISSAQKQSMIQANVPQITINSSPIQISTREKLLGVMVDSSLNLNVHIEKTIKKCNSLL